MTPGTRVTVRPPRNRAGVGTVEAVGATTLTVRFDGEYGRAKGRKTPEMAGAALRMTFTRHGDGYRYTVDHRNERNSAYRGGPNPDFTHTDVTLTEI